MADEKKVKHVVTNAAEGPRGFHATGGTILLDPGQSTGEAIEMFEAEYESAKATGYFKFGAAATKAADKE